MTLRDLKREGVLRVGDEVEYSTRHSSYWVLGNKTKKAYPIELDLTLLPKETGIEFPQTISPPKNRKYFIRKVEENGAIEIVPQKLELKVALGGMNGFCNVLMVLQKVCSMYDNFPLNAHAKSYELLDLFDETQDERVLPEPIRIACYPMGIFKYGITDRSIAYHKRAYFKDYSNAGNYRYYHSDGGGTKWIDKEDNLYRLASRHKPVYVTGYPRRYAHLKRSFKNFWIPYHGVQIECGDPTLMEKHLCYIDGKGNLQYEYMEKYTITEEHYVYPIIHVGADVEVEEVLIGYNTDKRIVKLSTYGIKGKMDNSEGIVG